MPEGCPRGTPWDAKQQEVIHNPDIRVKDAPMRIEIEPERRGGEKREEGEDAKPEDDYGDLERRRIIDQTTEVFCVLKRTLECVGSKRVNNIEQLESTIEEDYACRKN
ncbi:hypothetical protein NDU88_000673 [Pleurodeles waltl]|uniref:Uncharacterized protein n=1 Tax=Pleurodeles waltl TaxID=8319 RepID=A0AAV7NAC3_PLEWA|nr:hypothetical protein NDU88_000673 [Pleurodeles waltl]